MDNDYDLLIRVVSFAVGLWTAGHHFLASNALLRAPHWVKLFLLPAIVSNGVAICFASVMNGAGMVFLFAAPLVVMLSIKDFVVWRSGAFISATLDKQEQMKLDIRRAYNRYRKDLTTPWESVADLVTPSGLQELNESERKSKEHA